MASSIEYAKFVINNIPCLKDIDSVQALLEIKDPGNDEALIQERDQTVMQAIWDIRSSKLEGIRKLLSCRYELLPKTRAYLEWFGSNPDTRDAPFDYDGLKWNDTYLNMWYYNAFDHAITYHITRGWGLSAAFDSYQHKGWNYSEDYSFRPVDCSVWLATVEALSLQQAIPADGIPDDVVAEWGRSESISTIKKNVNNAAKDLLDQAIENSKDH